jgi:PKD repeat protein
MSTGNPTTWLWDFGDKGTSTEQHPEHIYQNPGEYTVTLTVTNEFGDSTEVREKYIRVLEKPVPLKASFMGEPTSGMAPLNVKFTDLSTGNPTTWLWNFGDNGSSSEQNPNHVYTQPGDYTVILTVTRGEDRSTEIRYQYIHVEPAGKPPVPDFVASPVTGNAPLTVTFTDLSSNDPTAWKWDFGDGKTATERNPVHVFQTPGVYSVCLEASNSFGSAKACKQNLITVLEPPLEPALFYGHVFVNGEQAPCDTMVEARGPGVQTGIPRNPVTNEEMGNYGIPDPLEVKGTIKNGEPVTFWIKTPGSAEFVQAECYEVYGSAKWMNSYPFRGGEKTRLDLRVGEGIPPMPVLPHEFFGEITYNGMPLAVGSTLTVKGENVIEGHVGNPLPITSPGVFGFEKLQKLVAQGDLKAGQPLTFWVTPAGSGETVQAEVRDIEAGKDWTSSFPYFEGGLTRLSIRAGGSTPPVPPTVPMTVSGKVTVDEKPAPVGSLITADGSGVKVGVDGNPVQVTIPGEYGEPAKLTIQGDISKGAAITFTIYDSQTGKECVAEIKDPATGQWVQAYPFDAGCNVVLDLRATSIIPMEVKES